MFWRIVGRLFRASRGRLAVALIAIASGAAVTTALVNLHFDAERKLSAEFRTLGANIVILPNLLTSLSAQSNFLRSNSKLNHPQMSDRFIALLGNTPQSPDDDPLSSPLVPQNNLVSLEQVSIVDPTRLAPFLYMVATYSSNEGATAEHLPVILAGTWLDRAPILEPWWKITGAPITDRRDSDHCLVGRSVARQLGLQPGSQLALQYADRNGTRSIDFKVAGVVDSGGQEDSQIFANLEEVQKLAGLGTSIGLIKINIPGTPAEVEHAVTQISAALPDLNVRPIPQIAQAEGQLLPRIQGLIYAMVALILVLTALCVFASMAALAMERRRDVGLMKAIGGKMSRIVAIFLTEAGALGLAGALIGYVAGIFLSRWIGWQAFGVAINARLEVLPLVVALMVGVALAGAFPLRMLGRIRPAEILRGE
jgi:putative ABC transport system permease protein